MHQFLTLHSALLPVDSNTAPEEVTISKIFEKYPNALRDDLQNPGDEFRYPRADAWQIRFGAADAPGNYSG